MVTLQRHLLGSKKANLSVCFIKYHAIKMYLGSGGIAPRILNLDTRWNWVVTFTPRPFYLRGKRPRYPVDRRLSELQSRSGRDGEEKKSHHCPCRDFNPGRPARSLVTVLTDLHRLVVLGIRVLCNISELWIQQFECLFVILVSNIAVIETKQPYVMSSFIC